MSIKRGVFIVAGILFFILVGTVFTVNAKESAVVLSFGAPTRTIVDSGLYFKAPWPIQNVVRFDKRVRVLSVPPKEILTSDKKNLVVESFAMWRVSEPQKFLESFRQSKEILFADLEIDAEQRLSDLIQSRVADSLGQKQFNELVGVGTESELLPNTVQQDIALAAKERFGVDILDVRLKHIGLPLQNEQSIYERMRAERLRIANAYRSEGEEQATTIKAKADREASEIIAEANKAAALILSEAEAASARMYAEAYSEDPAFYAYLRKLDAANAILNNDNNRDRIMVIDPKSEVFQELVK